MLLRELHMSGGDPQLHTTFYFHYNSTSLNTSMSSHSHSSQTPSSATAPFIMSNERSSKRQWTTKVESQEDDDNDDKEVVNVKNKIEECSVTTVVQDSSMELGRRKLQAITVARLRSIVAAFSRNRLQHMTSSSGLSGRVVGTLFGSKRGHLHFAFQKDPTSYPAFLIELAMPISGLVKEMASGLVRIALECDKIKHECNKTSNSVSVRLLQEQVFRTYCNGKKCGFATRIECGEKEWRLLKAIEPISMGAGVLPGNETKNGFEEVTYMRAKFERIVGSRDSEAFYMMNPDRNGAPELSVYLLRV